MSYLYVCEQGARISFEENRFDVRYNGVVVQSIPVEMVEIIEVFGKVQLTTQCITECLKRGINILYYSMYGAYYGRLISTTHVNVMNCMEKLREKDLIHILELCIRIEKSILHWRVI